MYCGAAAVGFRPCVGASTVSNMDGEEYETFSMELDMVLVLLIAISSWLSSEVSIHGTGNRR